MRLVQSFPRDSAPPLLLAHSLPAFGSAGLSVMLPILGTAASAVPTVLLNATADYPGVQRWPQPVVQQLEASWRFHHARGQRPDVFIGYLWDAAQALEIATWLRERRAQLGTVYCDPICGDGGRAYVAATLIAAWTQVLRQVDAAFPNATEWMLLANAAGADDAHSYWRSPAAPARVVVTSSECDGQYGNLLIEHGIEQFIAVEHLDASYRGTGDVFAACCLRALRSGLRWADAVHLASRQTESLIRHSLACGSLESLQVLPEICGEAIEH